MNPIEIREAYVRNNLLPRCGSAHVKAGKCCAIGALATDAGHGHEPYLYFSLKYPKTSAVHFAMGFDEELAGKHLPHQFSSKKLSESYRQGRAAAAAVKNLGEGK